MSSILLCLYFPINCFWPRHPQIHDIPITLDAPSDPMPTVPMHITTFSLPMSMLIPPLCRLAPSPHPCQPSLQKGGPLSSLRCIQKGYQCSTPHGQCSHPSWWCGSPFPLAKIFTVEATHFSLDPEPGVLPDCLLQMSLNCVFILLSMLTAVHSIT